MAAPIPLLVTVLATGKTIEYESFKNFSRVHLNSDRNTEARFRIRLRRSQKFEYEGFCIERLDHLDKIIPRTSVTKSYALNRKVILGFNYFTYEQAVGTVTWWCKSKGFGLYPIIIRLENNTRKRNPYNGWVFCYEDEFDGNWLDKEQAFVDTLDKHTKKVAQPVEVKDYQTGTIERYGSISAASNAVNERVGKIHSQLVKNISGKYYSQLVKTSKVMKLEKHKDKPWPSVAELYLNPHNSGYSLHQFSSAGGYGAVLQHFKNRHEASLYACKSLSALDYHFVTHSKLELPNNEVIVRNDSPEAIFLRKLRKEHGLD